LRSALAVLVARFEILTAGLLKIKVAGTLRCLWVRGYRR